MSKRKVACLFLGHCVQCTLYAYWYGIQVLFRESDDVENCQFNQTSNLHIIKYKYNYIYEKQEH